MRDRFSDASAELTAHNAYVCTSCETHYGHPTITLHAAEPPLPGLPGDPSTCVLNCDPMPFGD